MVKVVSVLYVIALCKCSPRQFIVATENWSVPRQGEEEGPSIFLFLVSHFRREYSFCYSFGFTLCFDSICIWVCVWLLARPCLLLTWPTSRRILYSSGKQFLRTRSPVRLESVSLWPFLLFQAIFFSLQLSLFPISWTVRVCFYSSEYPTIISWTFCI